MACQFTERFDNFLAQDLARNCNNYKVLVGNILPLPQLPQGLCAGRCPGWRPLLHSASPVMGYILSSFSTTFTFPPRFHHGLLWFSSTCFALNFMSDHFSLFLSQYYDDTAFTAGETVFFLVPLYHHWLHLLLISNNRTARSTLQSPSFFMWRFCEWNGGDY